MQNAVWLLLDNHVEKLLKDIFLSKSILTISKDIKSLTELLSVYNKKKI
jgi:hypothetical protein